MIPKTISVFGGSSPKPGDDIYQMAQNVGRLLAEAGFAVATGGYIGTMEAVSRGAAEAGGHVIGVTAAQIERFRPIGPNPWVKEEIRFDTLQERLLHLVKQNHGIITLPGGIGTISEMTLAWSFVQTGELSQRPLVLLGSLWHETMQAFYDPRFIKEAHLHLLHFAGTPQAAVDVIATFNGFSTPASPASNHQIME